MISTHSDERGDLTVLDRFQFDVKRVYFIHNVPSDKVRGGHAHKKTLRAMVAVKGSFDAYIDGHQFVMDDPTKAVFIGNLVWLELRNFSPDAVCLMVASTEHDESDCIRSIEELTKLKAEYSN